MNEPIWLSKKAIFAIHQKLLEKFGGSSGLRDEGLLESALFRPVNLFHYVQPSIFELAACYAEGLVKNHPFVDGNKRVGFVAAYTFLGANGFQLQATEEEAVAMTLQLAEGSIGAEEYAEWLKKNSCPREAES